jgi:hypothetical protein
MKDPAFWLKECQNILNSLGGSKIQLELIHYSAYGYILFSRTQEADPDGKITQRVQNWSLDWLINNGLISAYQVAQHILSYWEARSGFHQGKMATNVCDCTLGGAHETWCHKWEAY